MWDHLLGITNQKKKTLTSSNERDDIKHWDDIKPLRDKSMYLISPQVIGVMFSRLAT